MAATAAAVLGLAGAFGVGAWLMFSARRELPGLYDHCVRCGNDLTGLAADYCPRCKRRLEPDMIVRCARTRILGGRVMAGGLIVAGSAVAAAMLLADGS